ncbi:MAG: tRNA pseudouridine(13) synthase TruD [Methanobacteriota archaeon]
MVEIKPPKLEVSCGLTTYKSKSTGIGGVLKLTPEDFIVEEVIAYGSIASLEGETRGEDTPCEFTHFTLVKKNWDTMRAVKEISRRVKVSQKRFSFAGTKDKNAITSQRVSAQGVSISDLERVSIKDLTLKEFSYSDEPVQLGGLWGNKFTITIRGINHSQGDIKLRVTETMSELSGGFPSFFGLQRFGVVRPITHLVGKKVVLRDFEGAVKTYLCETFPGVEEEEKKARQELDSSWDVKEALKSFPKRLGYEKAMLNFLVEHPSDFKGALYSLPRNLSMMFVHAYQSFIFNRALSDYVEKGYTAERLPLVGSDSLLDEVSSQILEDEGVKPSDFTTSKGTVRDCFTPVSEFNIIDVSSDELNPGKQKLTVSFKLEKGCYATVFLREIIKAEYW